jgi:hypothetical protein
MTDNPLLNAISIICPMIGAALIVIFRRPIALRLQEIVPQGTPRKSERRSSLVRSLSELSSRDGYLRSLYPERPSCSGFLFSGLRF